MKFKFIVFPAALGLSFALLAAEQGWIPLAEDGLHDPESPAIQLLQEPAEALSQLPEDNSGNKVSWIEALRDHGSRPCVSNISNRAPTSFPKQRSKSWIWI
jgi:hypothetical protein